VLTPALVILAAGMSRRFGGDKQTVPLGPGGATLMEYAIFDALRAGFGRVVVVVRAERREAVQASLEARLRGRAPVVCVVQKSDRDRTGPWGTAHAVLSAAGEVRESFAVVNADDFYGRESFAAISGFLAAPGSAGAPAYVIAGFPLGGTLSDAGPVNRAVCETDAEGWLVRIVERMGIVRGDAPDDTLVSMNFWGFTPAVFAQLEPMFDTFRRVPGANRSKEFLLPDAVGRLVAARAARVRVLPARGEWCGVTYPADAPRVAAHLAALTTSGVYPADLWA
jgi:NDP-sugar pyrophosphorylase family protein